MGHKGATRPTSTRVTCCSHHRDERRVGSLFTSRFTCGISISDDDDGGGGGGSSGEGGGQGGGTDHPFGGFGAARLPTGAEEVSVLIAVNECHRQKEKQNLPPKIPEQNLARLLKTPISKG